MFSVALYGKRNTLMMTNLSITLSHQGPAMRLKPIEQGVTIFTTHKLNYLNAKNPNPAVTQTTSNMQSRHMPREPHNNWDGISVFYLT